MKNRGFLQKIIVTIILIAIGIALPVFSPAKLILEPASYTFAVHVPIFIAMFISPLSALAVVAGTTLGFFFGGFPTVIVLRAASHILFALIGAVYLRVRPETLFSPLKSLIFSAVFGLIHAWAEVMVVSSSFLNGDMAGTYYTLSSVVLLVGLGSFVHSMVDFGIALAVLKFILDRTPLHTIFVTSRLPDPSDPNGVPVDAKGNPLKTLPIRAKVFSTILLLAIAIVVFGIGSGMVFVQNNIDKTIVSDMDEIAQIADTLVTSEINLLKSDAATIARHVYEASESDIPKVLREQVEDSDKFIGLTVIDRDGIVASYGTAETLEMVQASEYIPRAFSGESVISTTRITPDGEMVFFVVVPMEGRVLSAAIPGMFFANIVSEFTIWETGNIFVLDAEGTVIADQNHDLVRERYRSLSLAETDKEYQGIAETASHMIKGERGAGKYAMYGSDRICVYTPITGSRAGWSLGVVAPLEEGPLQDLRSGLILVGLICVALSVASALIASAILERPYKKVNELVEKLEAEAVIRDEMTGELVVAREAAIASAEAKSDFLANMSHEMRTPLNAIIGFSELTLDSEEIRGGTKDNIEKIYNSGVTLLSLINDILDISKIESGKFEFVPVEYDMPSLINDTATLNIVRIGSKPITFALHAEETLPGILIGDELRIKQVFNNLLSNAFKYTQEGRVDWTISSEQDEDGLWLVSSVKDTGIGIRPEDQKKLFSEYNQVDTKSNRKIEGTGLGLSICKNIVEMMGGTVTVESEYGKGSTFTVRFRQERTNDVIIGKEVAENLQHFHYNAGKRNRSANLVRTRIPYARVLIVDDVVVNLDVARGMMKPYAMQIDCVTSGQEAIDLIRDSEIKYNAIFMDHMMPEMDGIEATRIIREEIGTDYAKNIPIIALTANALVGNEDMFLQKGFQAFLSKPIDIMRMDVVINHWVRDKELEKSFSEGMENSVPAWQDLRSGEDRRRIGTRRSGFDRRDYEGAGKLKIAGLDVTQGLKFFDEDEKTYLSIVKSYVQNMPSLLDQLKDCTEETLPNYSIVVHGIKSSSRTIGAEPIGTRAEELELAAKAGDFAFVSAQNDDFLRSVQELLDQLSDMLRDLADANPKPVKEEPDADVLAELREASRNFDIEEAEKAMEELEHYDYRSGGELVEWLRSQLDVMGFKKMAERLEDTNSEKMI